MKGFQESTYGDRIADVYDELHSNLSSPDHVDPVVDVLAELAGDGRALELGVGTGRIALPLAARGIEVHGIDASETMLEKLRQKPGGRVIPVTLGDFVELEVEENSPLSTRSSIRSFPHSRRNASSGASITSLAI